MLLGIVLSGCGTLAEQFDAAIEEPTEIPNGFQTHAEKILWHSVAGHSNSEVGAIAGVQQDSVPAELLPTKLAQGIEVGTLDRNQILRGVLAIDPQQATALEFELTATLTDERNSDSPESVSLLVYAQEGIEFPVIFSANIPFNNPTRIQIDLPPLASTVFVFAFNEIGELTEGSNPIAEPYTISIANLRFSSL